MSTEGKAMVQKFTSVGKAFIILSAVALGISTSAAQAKIKYTVLHSFGAANDGNAPNGDLVVDSSGNLYGTTQVGGTSNAGTIFKLAPDGAETVLHSFDGKAGGAKPFAGVTIDLATGDLYGTTTVGGSNYGVIWKLATDGTYAVLYSFDYTHGAYPTSLIRDNKGNLYGATAWSVNGSEGVVYELNSRRTYEVLHWGSFPYGRLTRDSAGNLYGTMQDDGGDYGSIFELAPDGTVTILHQFNNYDDGADPTGGLTRDKNGNLYGTTQQGGNGAVLFEVAADGTYTVMHNFAEVGLPNEDMIRAKDGTFYGTSRYDGSVYSVAPDGTEQILYNFPRRHLGEAPVGGLLLRNNVLYGAATRGGPNKGGVVFSLTTK